MDKVVEAATGEVMAYCGALHVDRHEDILGVTQNTLVFMVKFNQFGIDPLVHAFLLYFSGIFLHFCIDLDKSGLRRSDMS